MRSIRVSYSHRVDGDELVNHDKDVTVYQEACSIIDHYPWQSELALTEELGEGGGFYFLLGDYQGQYAAYQFVPMEPGKGLLDLDIVQKRGLLNFLGRKALSKSFELVSIAEAKIKIKELFEHSVDSLYQKYTM